LAGLVAGAGRRKLEDSIDHAAGIVMHRKIGDSVNSNEPVATVYGNDKEGVRDAQERIRKAYRLGDNEVGSPTLIYGMADINGYRDF
jgi:pyrimidine-nucleoside phosphorylase